MKKFLYTSTVIALILGAISFLPSCKANHDDIISNQNSYLNYEFSVDDQINVKQYEIEISTTGNVNNPGDWTTGFILMSETGGLSHNYTAQVDVTHWFKDVRTIYSRIKSVDIDGKTQYSKVTITKYQ